MAGDKACFISVRMLTKSMSLLGEFTNTFNSLSSQYSAPTCLQTCTPIATQEGLVTINQWLERWFLAFLKAAVLLPLYTKQINRKYLLFCFHVVILHSDEPQTFTRLLFVYHSYVNTLPFLKTLFHKLFNLGFS